MDCFRFVRRLNFLGQRRNLDDQWTGDNGGHGQLYRNGERWRGKRLKHNLVQHSGLQSGDIAVDHSRDTGVRGDV